ncbi:MAG: tetratricopeptide repeat protein [Candidatus Sericytochromatia bacterium]|nr:tetratricopeptide repeat protein [Candidatus Sericytochromatia bacterium]
MDVISVDQAADYLQCAASRVYRLIHSQQLAATKINRYWYICQRSLRDFCQQEMLQQGQERFNKSDYAGALKIFEAMQHHFPDLPEGYHLAAKAAERSSQYRLAFSYYRQAAQKFDHLPAYRALARLHFAHQQYNKAYQTYEYLLRHARHDFHLLYQLGLCAQHLQRPEAAISFFQQALKLNDCARGWDGLAYSYYQLGDYAAALRHYQEAHARDQKQAEYVSGIALAYHALGQIGEALQWYQRSLAMPHVSPRLYFSLALAYEDLGERSRAIEAFKSYLRYFPYCSDGSYRLALLLMEQQAFKAAASVLHKVVQLSPDNGLAWHYLALVETRLNHYHAAFQAYQQALKHLPESEWPQTYAHLAQTFVLAGQPEKAHKACDRALKQNPEQLEALNVRAGLYYSVQAYAEAAALYEQLWQKQADQPLHAYHLGLCYFRRQQHDAAIEVYQSALKRHPEAACLHHGLGQAYLGSKEHLKALRCFYRALALKPDFSPSICSLGQLYTEQQQFDQALKWFQKLIDQQPDNAEAWIQAGFAHDNLNNLKQAISCYQKALQLDPRNISIYVILGLACSRQGYIQNAIRTYREAMVQLPEEAGEMYYLMGLAWLNAGQKEEAIAAFENAGKHPHSSQHETWQHLGHLYLQTRQAKAAVGCFRRVIAEDMQDARAYVSLAQAYDACGDQRRALKYCQTALKIRPDDPEVLYQIALLHFRQDRWREALPYFQQVVRLDPQHARAHNYLGSIFRSMDCNLEAIRCFQTALEAEPDYCVGYMNLSYTYFDLNELPKAIYYCEKAIECEPECEEPLYWLGHLYMSTHKWAAAVNRFEETLQINPEHAKARKWLPVARQQWIRERNGTQPLKMPNTLQK